MSGIYGQLPLGPPGHVHAERDDPPAELVPENRHRLGLPVLQRVHVRPAQPARLHRHDDIRRSRGGIGTSPTAVPIPRSTC